MKKLDKIISYTVLVILFITIITSFIIDYKLTIKAIGNILFVFYMIFVILHIAICLPTLAPIMLSLEYLQDDLQNIKEKSIILEYSIRIGIVLWHIFILWIVIPIIISMMINTTTDIDTAIDFIKQFNN